MIVCNSRCSRNIDVLARRPKLADRPAFKVVEATGLGSLRPFHSLNRQGREG